MARRGRSRGVHQYATTDEITQTGFTLIEAMISIVILAFGILSLAVVYAQGIQITAMTQMNYIAEKKAEQAMETIFAARDSHILQWTNIRNVTGGGGGDRRSIRRGPHGTGGGGS